MSENVDRSLLEHWREARARHVEELRFLGALERERPSRTSQASLFADQLAELRERVERQRVATSDPDSWDEPA